MRRDILVCGSVPVLPNDVVAFCEIHGCGRILYHRPLKIHIDKKVCTTCSEAFISRAEMEKLNMYFEALEACSAIGEEDDEDES